MGKILKSITATVVVLCFVSVPGSRESLPPQAVVLLSRAPHPPSPADEFRSCRFGLLVEILRLATFPPHRQTGDLSRLAPQAFKLFWKWKSRPGRPRLPKSLRQLISEMVRDHPSWGQKRIADELGIRVSPRAVRAYWPGDGPSIRQAPSQNWNTFLRNHAEAVLACDFFLAVTVRFRIIYILGSYGDCIPAHRWFWCD
jgi:hypothetical protein